MVRLQKCDRCGKETITTYFSEDGKLCLLCYEADQEEELKREISREGYIPFQAIVREWNDGKIIWIPKAIAGLIKSNKKYTIRLYEVRNK